MSCFSFSSPSLLPSPLPGSGSAKRASEGANEPVAAPDSHSQRAIPFGHAILSQNHPENLSHGVATMPGRYTIPDGQALSLGTEGTPKSTQQAHRSLYTTPLYFRPTAGCDRGVLVTGLENNTKYSILRHLIRSAWSIHDPSPFRGILCFTTDHGSFGVATSATLAAQDVGQEAEVVVLTVPWKVSELSANLAGTAKNISVLPIKVHLQDVSLGHLAFLQSVYQPDWHPFHAQEQARSGSISHDDIPAQLRCFLSTNGSTENQLPSASLDWVSWTRSRQSAMSAAAEKGTSIPNDPFLLCVDLSGFDPTELVLQHTLADIITKSWSCHVEESTPVPAQSLVVCDDAHIYLSQDESPFSRTLASLVAPLPLSKTPASKTTPHLVILSQSPVSLAPNVLDHLSYLIIHRFTAPRWLQSLEKHWFLQPRVHQVFNITDNTVSDANLTSISTIEQILDLEAGRVLVCFKGHDQSQNFQANKHNESAGAMTNGHPRNVFGPIQRPTVKPATTSPSLGRQLLMVSLKPVSIPITSPMRTTGSTALYPPANLDHTAAKRSPQLADLEIGSTNSVNYGGIRPSLLSSSVGIEGGAYEPWRQPSETQLGTPASVHVSLHSPPGIGTIGRSIPRTTSSPFDTIVSPTASSPEVPLNRGTVGSFNSTYLSAGAVTSPISPTSRGVPPGGATFSPFSMARRGQEVAGTSQYGNSFSNSSSSISSHFFPAHGDGNGVPSPHLDRYRPMTMSMSSASEGQFSKADTDSGGGDFVDVGAMRDALPSSNGRPLAQAGVATSGGGPAGSSGPSSSYGLAALGLKRSYAGVTAPVSDGTIQRRATAILLGPQMDTAGRSQVNGVGSSNASNQFSSSEGVGSTGPSSSPPPPPPVYPESFFWPLLDALEKARVQVSSPHNRAQCVRHSVVGQELPPSARARLGLTFKEYVAAAARQGVVVTGDSGDKAWIAMQDWRFPGKSNSVNGHSATQGQRMTNK